jgi:hypothetical protein
MGKSDGAPRAPRLYDIEYQKVDLPPGIAGVQAAEGAKS